MDVAGFTSAQRALWRRVELLWGMLGGDEAPIRAALHPRYWGWVVGEDSPHDREHGVRSAAQSPPLLDLHLEPLRVEVYDRTGVVHYTYRATLGPTEGESRTVTGRWTEVYVKDDGAWLLVAVSGGPDPS